MNLKTKPNRYQLWTRESSIPPSWYVFCDQFQTNTNKVKFKPVKEIRVGKKSLITKKTKQMKYLKVLLETDEEDMSQWYVLVKL